MPVHLRGEVGADHKARGRHALEKHGARCVNGCDDDLRELIGRQTESGERRGRMVAV